MASTSRPTRSVLHGLEQVILIVLLGIMGVALLISLFLGPVLLFPVIVCAVIALGIDQFMRREDNAPSAIAEVREPALSGRIVRVIGQCPIGPTPGAGQAFSVMGDEVQPALCEHARRAILDEVARIEDRGEIGDEPVHYQDADHELAFELYRTPTALRAAA